MQRRFSSFSGRHYETGTLANAFAHLGACAPHTGSAFTEEFLLGVSGGITFGYFLFDYKGHDPMCNLLTRNTFDPFNTVLQRLGVPQTVRQFGDAQKADAALADAVKGDGTAIVWADHYSLPFTGHKPGAAWWAMLPTLVFGYDGLTAHVAAGPPVACIVAAADLRQARARVAKERHRMLVIGAPDARKVKEAALQGIRQCVALFADKPPKGAAENFGFAALRHWAAMLTNTRNPKGWARYFPAGARLYSALAGSGMSPGVFGWLTAWGFGDGAERDAYALFLDEAADLLGMPFLRQSATKFRASAALWRQLADAVLPTIVPEFAEVRELKAKRRAAYTTQGKDSIAAMQAIDGKLDEIRAGCGLRYPMDADSISAQLAHMAGHLLQIHDVEHDAVKLMRAA